MNQEEFNKHLKPRLDEYNFKYDDNMLFALVKEHPSKSVMQGYENIIVNHPKLFGINIIYEMTNELKNSKPLFSPFQLLETCNICDKSGLVTLESPDRYEFAFACNCGYGRKILETNKLIKWNGQLEQKIDSEIYKLHWVFKLKKEEQQRVGDEKQTGIPF